MTTVAEFRAWINQFPDDTIVEIIVGDCGAQWEFVCEEVDQSQYADCETFTFESEWEGTAAVPEFAGNEHYQAHPAYPARPRRPARIVFGVQS